MINLLPPAHKEQVRFSKLNRIALRYLRLVVAVSVVIGAIFVGTIVYLNMQSNRAEADIASKRSELQAASAFQKQAAAVADRLLAIKAVQASQTRFSSLLSDLAKSLPKGVAIDTITLTGDDTKPVRITVTGSSYTSLLSLRDALAASARIAGADLENIAQDDNGYHAAVVLAFKKGQAK